MLGNGCFLVFFFCLYANIPIFAPSIYHIVLDVLFKCSKSLSRCQTWTFFIDKLKPNCSSQTGSFFQLKCCWLLPLWRHARVWSNYWTPKISTLPRRCQRLCTSVTNADKRFWEGFFPFLSFNLFSRNKSVFEADVQSYWFIVKYFEHCCIVFQNWFPNWTPNCCFFRVQKQHDVKSELTRFVTTLNIR